MIINLPLVSVIVPCYNHEKFVIQSIRSIINQTYQNIELIIFNDGSTDSTHEQILKLEEECLKRFSNYIYLNKANEGLAKTLNRGIRLSKGAFISLISSDDVYLPNKIELQLDKLLSTSNEIGAIYSDGYIIDSNGNRVCNFSDKYPVPIFNNVYKNLLIENWICAVSLLYKRETLMSAGLFTENIKVEDHDMLLKISAKHDIIYIDEKLVEYRWHGANFSSNPDSMYEQLLLTANYHPKLESFRSFCKAIRDRSIRNFLLNFSHLNADLLIRRIIRQIQKNYISNRVFNK